MARRRSRRALWLAVLWLRFAKLLGVFLLFCGAIAATVPLDMPLATRRRFALFGSGLGMLITWSLGFVLAGIAGHRLLATWIVGSLGLTLLSLQGVLYTVGREGRSGWKPFFVAVLPLVAAAALMVWRPA
ncbi:MAG: hypothetical protein AAGE52_09365 [Myxococcota bacterium]